MLELEPSAPSTLGVRLGVRLKEPSPSAPETGGPGLTNLRSVSEERSREHSPYARSAPVISTHDPKPHGFPTTQYPTSPPPPSQMDSRGKGAG